MKVTRALALLTALCAAPLHAGQAPGWLDGVAGPSNPAQLRKSDLVVLLRQEMLDVSKGSRQSHVREAVRIQTSAGLKRGVLLAGQSLGEEFKMTGGWIVRPDGSVRDLDRASLQQVDADDSYEFTMNRVNALAPEGLRVGDVLAWEYTTRGKPEFYGEFWQFGDSDPVLRSRFGLRLPKGWKMSLVRAHRAEIPYAMDDEGYAVWEMRDLPAPEQEPDMPPYRDLTPAVLVAFGPGDQAPPEFTRWEGVASWYAAIVEKQLAPDDLIRSTAARLGANPSSPMDAIQKVTRFVQGVRYLNVAVGRSVAEPHPASKILINRYGDCEDKSVLTIALLRQLGIEAWPMLANTASGGEVDPDFPMPGLFNHAITAIKLPPGVDPPPASVEAGPLGRLLIFDATDPLSGVGDLGADLQGTRALLAHSTQGRLVTLPVLAPAASARRMQVTASFPQRGGLDVKAAVTYTGQYGSIMRAYYAEHRGDNGKDALAGALSSRYGRVEIRTLQVDGLEGPGDPVSVSLELWMPAPGQDLGNLRTMGVVFPLRTRADAYAQPRRSNPLVLRDAYLEETTMTIDLPAGWHTEGPLPSAKASAAVGEYALESSSADGKLQVTRTLTVRAAQVAPADYTAARKFFDDVMKGDSLAVALEKTPR